MGTMPPSQHILLAEDDDQYAFIIQVALKKAGIEHVVHRLTSRHQVIHYMTGEGRFWDRAAYPVPARLALSERRCSQCRSRKES